MTCCLARSELASALWLARIVAPLHQLTASLDDSRLTADGARYAADLGFGGKLAIYPKQIDPITADFAPSAEAVA